MSVKSNGKNFYIKAPLTYTLFEETLLFLHWEDFLLFFNLSALAFPTWELFHFWAILKNDRESDTTYLLDPEPALFLHALYI